MRFLLVGLVGLVLGCRDDLTPAEARLALADLGIKYTENKFLDAAKRGDLVVVKLFLQAGMSVDTANADGLSALHLAAREGHLAVVEFLVGAGADVNAKDDLGNTVLHRAARGGSVAVVRYLVEEHGLDVTAKVYGGGTPRDEVVKGRHTAIARYLRSVGG